MPRPYCRTDRPVSRRRRPLALVVDDLDAVRECIGLILWERLGVRTVGAASSEVALSLAQQRKFDVVTSDLTRAGMNGLEFLRVFNQAHPTVPVIIVSAALDEAKTRRARCLGAFGCLSKPFTCGGLVGLVRAAIASRRVCRTVLRLRRRTRFPPT